MVKGEAMKRLEAKARSLAEQMAFKFVDAVFERERGSTYLRFYLDKSEGLSLNDCEKFHRALLPMTDEIDFDFLEVSSPGLDRPIRTPDDYERYLGESIELRFYTPVNGSKRVVGTLSGYSKECITLTADKTDYLYNLKDIALAKPIIDMSDVQNAVF
jgi:ribosome maturation factor RimP